MAKGIQLDLRQYTPEEVLGGTEILGTFSASVMESSFVLGQRSARGNVQHNGSIYVSKTHLGFFRSGMFKKAAASTDLAACDGWQVPFSEIASVTPFNYIAVLVPVPTGIKVTLKDGSEILFAVTKRKQFLDTYQQAAR